MQADNCADNKNWATLILLEQVDDDQARLHIVIAVLRRYRDQLILIVAGRPHCLRVNDRLPVRRLFITERAQEGAGHA